MENNNSHEILINKSEFESKINFREHHIENENEDNNKNKNNINFNFNSNNMNISSCPKIYIVAGLLYGDEGKGTTVDYLSFNLNTNLIVRYGGGPQAAHHVVLPDGLNTFHCFSQLSSGSFNLNCKTLLSKFMFVNPITLLKEIEIFSTKGIMKDIIYKNLKIDKNCFIVTPYHKLINYTKEILRKKNNHGSTGLGVGNAIDEAMYANKTFFPKAEICWEKEKLISLKHQNYSDIDEDNVSIQIKDFYDRNNLYKKLKSLIEQKEKKVFKLINDYYIFNSIDKDLTSEDKYVKEVLLNLKNFKDDYSLVKLLKIYYDWFDDFNKKGIIIPDGIKVIEDSLKENFDIIFEGSQGSLLDRIYGFYPHITKTLCSDSNAQALINEINNNNIKENYLNFNVVKIGVLRSYSSRHGKGPFVTHSKFFSDKIKEEHNQHGRFQGNLISGPLDFIAIKYGMEIFKPDFISFTCVDKILKNLEINLLDKNTNTNTNNNINNDIEYIEEIENIDFYFCENYILVNLDLPIDNKKNKNNKNILKKNKAVVDVNINITKEKDEDKDKDIEIIKIIKNDLIELEEKGIFSYEIFKNFKDLENFLINKDINKEKKFYINLNKIEKKHLESYGEIIVIKDIKKFDDFYNFKNNKLANILNLSKPVYSKLNSFKEINNEKISSIFLKEENVLQLKNYIYNNLPDEKKLKGLKEDYLNYIISNLIEIERNIKVPFKLISFGPTRIDKVYIY
jgi:adenylosuccinate synthase